jgi:ABC-type nitrate/sulfonate/bicarbonate transport system substrate-binding protein
MNTVKRRHFLKGIGATAAAGALAGCSGNSQNGSSDGGDGGSGGDDGGNGGSDSTATESDGELSQSSVSVLLTYFPDMVFSPMTGANAFGYFEEVGLDVTIESSLAVQNPLQVLVGGEYDVIVGTPFSYTTALARGIPVETVFTTIGSTPLSYASMGDSGIEGVEDWPESVLGLQNEADRNWVTPYVYDQVGLDSEQQEAINQRFIGYSVTNLTEGNVDVMSLYPTNSDYNSLRILGEDFNVVEAQEYTNAPGNCALTTQQFSQEHPDTLTEFTRAWTKACEESMDESNRDRFAEMTLEQLEAADADVFLGDVDPLEVERSNFDQFLNFRPAEIWESNGVGYNDPAAYAEVQQMGVDVGAISEGATTAEGNLVSNTYVNAVHDDSGELQWPE